MSKKETQENYDKGYIHGKKDSEKSTTVAEFFLSPKLVEKDEKLASTSEAYRQGYKDGKKKK